MSGGELIAFHSAAAISEHRHGRTHARGEAGVGSAIRTTSSSILHKSTCFEEATLVLPGMSGPLLYLFLHNGPLVYANSVQQCT